MEDADSSGDEFSSVIDEYTEWQGKPRQKDVDDPIAYWFHSLSSHRDLANSALSIFALPAMSAGPERVFRAIGHMLEPSRACLRSDIVGAASCLKQWGIETKSLIGSNSLYHLWMAVTARGK